MPNLGRNAKLVKTQDGGFTVFFKEHISNTVKSNLYKYDSQGNFVWVQEIVSDVLFSVRVRFIYNTPDNGFILTASRTYQNIIDYKNSNYAINSNGDTIKSTTKNPINLTAQTGFKKPHFFAKK
jgi:hypothetical protein